MENHFFVIEEEVEHRCFPRWMLALDPLLARSDSNRLFVMLEEFAEAHPRLAARAKGGRWRWAARVAEVPLLALCVYIGFKGWFILLLAPLVALALLRLPRLALPIRREGFTIRLGSAFTIIDRPPLMASDLWLAGFHGSEVAETIYCQERTARLRWAVVSYPFWAVAPWIGYALGRPPYGLWGILLTFAYGFFAYQLFRLLNWNRIREDAILFMRLRLAGWGGGRAAARAVITHPMITLVVAGLFLQVMAFLLAGTASPVGYLGAGSIFLLAGALMLGLVPDAAGALQNRFEEVLREADIAFAVMVGEKAHGDDLARAWALWYYNPARLREEIEKKAAREPAPPAPLCAPITQAPPSTEVFLNEYGQPTLRRSSPSVQREDQSNGGTRG